jgi:rubredoxin
VCGYNYDPEQEDCAFDELPEDWVCPICGAAKEQFDKAI